jgi:hypothetical protein
VERLWPGRTVRVERLTGGMTNANYLADLDDEQVVVRIPVARTLACWASTGATRRGQPSGGQRSASPPDVARIESSTRATWSPASFPPERCPRANWPRNRCWKRWRSPCAWCIGAGTVEAVFNPFHVVATTTRWPRAKGVTEPFDYDRRARRARPHRHGAPLSRPRPSATTTCSTRTSSTTNGSASSTGSTRDGRPLLRPRQLLDQSRVNGDADDLLLGHYFGHVDEGLRSLLALMRLVSEMREAMWGVVQLAISEIDMDFDAYCQRRAQRFATLLAEMDIGRAGARERGRRGPRLVSALRRARARWSGRRAARPSRWRPPPRRRRPPRRAPDLRVVRRQVGVGDRLLDAVAVAAARDAPDGLAVDAHRLRAEHDEPEGRRAPGRRGAASARPRPPGRRVR